MQTISRENSPDNDNGGNEYTIPQREEQVREFVTAFWNRAREGMTAYGVLDISPSASKTEIKKKAQAINKLLHTDVVGVQDKALAKEAYDLVGIINSAWAWIQKHEQGLEQNPFYFSMSNKPSLLNEPVSKEVEYQVKFKSAQSIDDLTIILQGLLNRKLNKIRDEDTGETLSLNQIEVALTSLHSLQNYLPIFLSPIPEKIVSSLPSAFNIRTIAERERRTITAIISSLWSSTDIGALHAGLTELMRHNYSVVPDLSSRVGLLDSEVYLVQELDKLKKLMAWLQSGGKEWLRIGKGKAAFEIAESLTDQFGLSVKVLAYLEKISENEVRAPSKNNGSSLFTLLKRAWNAEKEDIVYDTELKTLDFRELQSGEFLCINLSGSSAPHIFLMIKPNENGLPVLKSCQKEDKGAEYSPRVNNAKTGQELHLYSLSSSIYYNLVPQSIVVSLVPSIN